MASGNRTYVVPVIARNEDIQQLVYGLVRDTAERMLRPTSRYGTLADDGNALYWETVAETLAWEVAVRVESSEHASSRLTH